MKVSIQSYLVVTAGILVALQGCTNTQFAIKQKNQTIQGPTPLILNEHFETIDLISLLTEGVEETPAEPTAQDLEKAFQIFNDKLDGTHDELYRNRVQERILAASDQRCGEYKQFLKNFDSQTNFMWGSLTTAAGAAGAILSGGTATRVASGLAALFSGVRAESNNAFFSNLAIHVITSGFEAKRRIIYGDLLKNRKLGITEYPVERAVKDAVFYHENCSLIAGLEEAAESIQRASDPGLQAVSRVLDEVNAIQGKTHLPENMRDGAAMPTAAFERAEQSLKKLSALINELRDVNFPEESSLTKPPDTEADKQKEYDDLIRDIKKATSEKAELETSIPPLLTKATEEPADDSPGGLLHSSEKDKLVEFEKKWGGLFSAREVASDRLSIDKANAAIMLQQAEGAQWVEKYNKLRQALDEKIEAVADLKKKNEDLNKQAKKFVK